MTEGRVIRLVLLGPPGAGKGTQARLLSQKLSVPQISTGDILREEVKLGSEIGISASKYMNQGLLVPDSIVIRIVERRLSRDDCLQGYILDGFPRTLVQAEAMTENDIAVDHVIFFDVEDEILVQRLSGRRICPSCNKMYHVLFEPPKTEGLCDVCHVPLIIRKDDSRETVMHRIQVYRKETQPLINYYKGSESIRFHTVDNGPDGREPPDEIAERVAAILTGVVGS